MRYGSIIRADIHFPRSECVVILFLGGGGGGGCGQGWRHASSDKGAVAFDREWLTILINLVDQFW